MDETKLRVLVGCEESQRVCAAFRRLGHEAYSCDLVPCSGGHPEWHIMGDVRDVLNGGSFQTIDGKDHHVERWDIGIFHPPCTYFTVASACRLYHRDQDTHQSFLDKSRYRKGLKLRRLFLACLNASNIGYRAVENPTPMSIWNLPQYSQVIQPWNFNWHDEQGNVHEDNYQKRTLLWLRGLPPLIPDRTEKPEETMKWVNAGTKQADGSKLERIGLHNSSRERSKTFMGIAEAMAKQWSSYVIERKKATKTGQDGFTESIPSEGQIEQGEDDVIPFIGDCQLSCDLGLGISRWDVTRWG